MGLTPLMHPKSTVAKWEIQKQCGFKSFVIDTKHVRTCCKALLVSFVSHAEAFAPTPEGAVLRALC